MPYEIQTERKITMKNITTLEKAGEKVDHLSLNCTDHIIPVKDISLVDDLSPTILIHGPAIDARWI